MLNKGSILSADVNASQTAFFTWKYSINTSAGDPGSGVFRGNNVLGSLITQLYIDDLTSGNQVDISNLFSSVDGNWTIHIQQRNDASKWIQFESSSAYVDNLGWWTLNVTYVDSGTGIPLSNLTDCLFSFINTNGSTNTFVPNTRQLSINGNSYDLSTDREWRTAQADTGVLTFAGTTPNSATTVNIGAATGWIIDNETNPAIPVPVFVNYAGEINKTVTTVGSGTATYVMLGIGGVISFQNTFPTSAERKSKIWLSKLSHPAGSITIIVNEPDYITSPMAFARDMFQSIGPYINNNIIPFPNGANLTINITAGLITGNGINFSGGAVNRATPNNLPVSGSPISFFPRTETGAGGGLTSILDNGNYSLAGVVTAIPGANTRASLKYIYLVPGQGFVVQYGQEFYANLSDAIANIGREVYVIFPNLVGNSILLGVVACIKNPTAVLNNTAQARIFPADRLGQIIGATAGVAVGTLQTAYNNSLVPQTTVNALGALTTRNSLARGADTLTIEEWQNTDGITKASVTGTGLGTFTNTRLANAAFTFFATLDASAIAASDKTLTLQNLTGTIALSTNNLSFFSSTTSAQLAATMSDETGTGLLVFNNSPSLVTPLLGTPTSGVLTNCTGLPITTGVAGLAAGIAAFLATPTSANLATAVTNETGSGSLVFATSPTLVTPLLGTPTSGTLTNCIGLPIVAGTTGTLTETRGGTNQTTYTTGDILYASGANVLSKLPIGSATQILTVVAGIPTWASPTFSGTVTSVSVVSANGFNGSVATATTTPAITISTTINSPVLAGNGTALIAATTTGTGSTVVLQTSPSLITPLLGTPTSGILTNCTGLPITTGVSGLATNMAAFLAAGTSASLFSAITDPTGISSSLVFANQPNFVTGVSTLSATFSVFNVNATTINAFGAATAINMGVAGGTITTASPTLVGTQTTQNIYNTVATTGNILGAATAITMGAVTGTATIRNTTVALPGGTLTGAATQNVFQTGSSTVNAFGGATTLTMGATSGTTTIRGTTITFENVTTMNLNGASPTVASTSTGTLTLYNTNLLTVNAFGAATNATIGGTTATSTFNIANGATLNGSTKTINIGTSGVSGSTTFINIGSSVAGAGGLLSINLQNTTVGGSNTSASIDTQAATSINLFNVPSTVSLGGYTDTSTFNLFYGATLNGSTKTINIGTSGVSGSTTAISLGSQNVGAINNLKFNIVPASDTTGDTYYRASSGFVSRLGIGSNGQVLTIVAGLPAWAASGGTPTSVTKFSANVTTTVTNTVTETTILGTGIGTKTIAANEPVAGTQYRITVAGMIKSNGSQNITVRVKLGATTVLANVSNPLNISGNRQFRVEAFLTFQTIGAGGTVIGSGTFMFQETTAFATMVWGLDASSGNITTSAINTTVAQAINVTVEWASANINNDVSAYNTTIEKLN